MTENELLDELINELNLPDIDKDEVTIEVLAKKIRVSRHTAEAILEKKCTAGLLKSRYVRGVNNKKCKAYSKP